MNAQQSQFWRLFHAGVDIGLLPMRVTAAWAGSFARSFPTALAGAGAEAEGAAPTARPTEGCNNAEPDDAGRLDPLRTGRTGERPAPGAATDDPDLGPDPGVGGSDRTIDGQGDKNDTSGAARGTRVSGTDGPNGRGKASLTMLQSLSSTPPVTGYSGPRPAGPGSLKRTPSHMPAAGGSAKIEAKPASTGPTAPPPSAPNPAARTPASPSRPSWTGGRDATRDETERSGDAGPATDAGRVSAFDIVARAAEPDDADDARPTVPSTHDASAT